MECCASADESVDWCDVELYPDASTIPFNAACPHPEESFYKLEIVPHFNGLDMSIFISMKIQEEEPRSQQQVLQTS
jgi:hypothetical protein